MVLPTGPFHHQSGGHKLRLRLICPFEKNMESPFEVKGTLF
jgi:hypothetical protein